MHKRCSYDCDSRCVSMRCVGQTYALIETTIFNYRNVYNIYLKIWLMAFSQISHFLGRLKTRLWTQWTRRLRMVLFDHGQYCEHVEYVEIFRDCLCVGSFLVMTRLLPAGSHKLNGFHTKYQGGWPPNHRIMAINLISAEIFILSVALFLRFELF